MRLIAVLAALTLALVQLPAAASLRLDAFPSRTDIAPNETFTLSVVALNGTDAPLTQPSIVVAVPGQFGNVSSLPVDATCASPCRGGSTIIWSPPGAIPAGGAYVASFKTSLATSPAPAAGQLIPASAQLLSGTQPVATANTQIRAQPTAALQVLRLGASTQFAVPDERVALTASFGNISPTVTTLNNSLTLQVPSSLQILDAGGGVIGGNTVTWALGALSPGESGSRTVVARIATLAAPTLSALQSTLQNGSESTDARFVLAVHRAPALRVSIESDIQTVERNRQFAVRVRTTNTGSVPLYDVVVTSRAPQAASGPEAMDADGTCPSGCGSDREVRWTIAELTPGATRVFSYSDTTTNNNTTYGAAGQSMRFEAFAAAASERVMAINDLLLTPTRELEAGLGGPDALVYGEPTTLEVLGGNLRETVALNSRLVLYLPAGVTVLDADGATQDDGRLEWGLGTLAPGGFVFHRITVVAAPVASGPPSVDLFRDGFETGGASGGGQRQGNVPTGMLLAEVSDGTGLQVQAMQAVSLTAVTPRVDFRMSVTPNRAQRDELVTGEITLGNTGSDLFGVKVFLRTPQETDYFEWNIDGVGTCSGCGDGGRVLWDIGDLPAGTTRVLSFSVLLDNSSGYPTSGSLVEFDAWVTEAANLDIARARDVVAVGTKVLDVAIEDDADPVISGDSLAYTISYGNASAGTLTGATLSMPLPPGTVFGSASDGGTHAGGVVTWSIGTLAAGASGQRTLSMTVPTATPGAVLASTVKLADASGNVAYADVTTAQAAQAPLTLTLAVTPNRTQRDELVTGEITLGNTGSDLFGVKVFLRTPQEADYFEWTIDGVGTCSSCGDGGRVIWDIGDLPAGTTRVLSFSVLMDNSSGYPTSGSLVEFDAWVTEAANLDIARARDVVAVGTKVLDVAIEDDADPVLSGDTLGYTISYGNPSAGTLTGTTLSIPLPPGTVFGSASDGGTHAGGVVTWSIGTLAAGASGQRTLSMTVPTATPGAVLASTVKLADASGNVAYADVTTAQAAQAPLSLTLAVTPNRAQRDELVTGEITLGNTGGDLFGVKVFLRTPQETDYFEWTIDGVGTCSSCGDGGRVIWDIGDLPAGTTRVLSFSVLMDNSSGYPTSGSLVEFDAWVTEAANLDIARARDVVAVGTKVLDVAVEDDTDPVISGDSLAYTISYGNVSAGTLTGTTLSIPLPPGTVFGSASDGGTHAGGAVTWNIGTLAAGASGQRTLSVMVPTAIPGAVFASTVKLADAAGNVAYADVTTAQAAQAPLMLTLAVTPNHAPRDAIVNGAITLHNSGSNLFGVKVFLRTPQEMNYFEWDFGGAATCSGCGDGGYATWNIGDLPAGSTQVLNFSAEVDNASGPYPPSGSIVEFDAWVTEAANLNSARVREVIRVQ